MSPISDAAVAPLGFQLVAPGPVLRPYVREYWSFRADSVQPAYREEFMHPTGGFGLVFNLGDELYLDARPVAAPVFLDGATTRSRRMGFVGHVEVIGIRFHAGGAYPFLAVPLIELQNALNVLELRNDAFLIQLHSRLHETPSLAGRIGLMEEWLVRQLSAGVARSQLIPASLLRLRREIEVLGQHSGRVSIPKIADDLAISQRQLEHLYRSQVGMTPLQYVRLQRIERARLALSESRQSNTHLAAALGFYDQAHFIRDFQSVIGVTPYAYMRRKHGDAGQRHRP